MTKQKFQRNWMDENWQKFVDGELCDAKGRVITVADALCDFSADEYVQLNQAFRDGKCATYDAIEVIAKAWLLDVVVCHFYDEYLQKQEELKANMKDDEDQLAFENHDMKR